MVEGDCGGCVETTRTDKNLILSENKKFLQSRASHVTGNGDHVPWFRLAAVLLDPNRSIKLIPSVSEGCHTTKERAGQAQCALLF